MSTGRCVVVRSSRCRALARAQIAAGVSVHRTCAQRKRGQPDTRGEWRRERTLMQATLGLFSAGSVSGTGAARRPRAFLCSPAGGAERSCPRAARSTPRGRLSGRRTSGTSAASGCARKELKMRCLCPAGRQKRAQNMASPLRRSPLGGGRCRAHQKHQTHHQKRSCTRVRLTHCHAPRKCEPRRASSWSVKAE